MKNKGYLGTISLVVIGIVFGAVMVSGFGWVKPSFADVKIGAERPPVEKIDEAAAAFNNAFVNVAEKVTPSIVQITVVTKVKNDLPEGFNFFFPFRDDVPKEQQGGGSGIIISDDGYILTNNHVVEEAKEVTVTLHDKREIEATVVGTDPLTDLAVIKIDASNLTAAYLGDSDAIKVGQWVMAIGNPLSLASTVTAGIVSAVGRNINIIKDRYGVENFIQTDAAINPGNSGGALVDLNGSVIGINSAIATNGMTSSYIGYGFAIPINMAKSVANDLIANGKVSRGYIGVSISSVDAQTAKALGLSIAKGVLIQEVVKGGAASKEDIKEGDVIFKIDSKEVNEPNELQGYIASKRAGSEIKLTIFRDGKEIERYVTLKAKDDDNVETVASKKKDDSKENDSKSEEVFESLGMTVKNLSSAEKTKYKVDSGILISDVKNFGKAFKQNIPQGTIITQVDRKEVSSISEFKKLINSKKGDAVLLKIIDQAGTTRFVGLEIPQ
ncbi:MAG: Do family serine endopeptidase [Melioribacteraceae bacterium]